jgi:hypothetical protein
MRDVLEHHKDFLNSFESMAGLRIITNGRRETGKLESYVLTLVCEGYGGLYLCDVVQLGPTIDEIAIMVPMIPDIPLSLIGWAS